VDVQVFVEISHVLPVPFRDVSDQAIAPASMAGKSSC